MRTGSVENKVLVPNLIEPNIKLGRYKCLNNNTIWWIYYMHYIYIYTICAQKIIDEVQFKLIMTYM